MGGAETRAANRNLARKGQLSLELHGVPASRWVWQSPAGGDSAALGASRGGRFRAGGNVPRVNQNSQRAGNAAVDRAGGGGRLGEAFPGGLRSWAWVGPV